MHTTDDERDKMGQTAAEKRSSWAEVVLRLTKAATVSHA